MNIQILQQKFEPTWKSAYRILPKLIRSHGFKIGAELGVAFGGHAEEILKNTSVKKLYGVDPYKHIKEYNDVCNFPQREFDQLYSFTTKRLSVFKNRYINIRKFSIEAVNDIPNNLDFVYIDGDHSYEGVTKDLSAWVLKIRDNGIIGGHDYGHLNHPGIKKAVDIFFRRFNWKINVEKEGVWWVEKKPINISFIVPAYNCQKTLPEAIESIYNDNFSKGDETIIVDDASTDKTLPIAKSLQQKYPAIRIFRHHYNKGSAAAGRNTAIDQSKHELIFCLDADNVLTQKSIPKLKEYLIRSCSDIAVFRELRYFTKKTKDVTHKWVFPKIISLKDCFSTHQFPGASGNYLFTKESWIRADRYNESVGGACDSWTFGFYQLATGSKMVSLPHSFYYHRYGYQSAYVRDSAIKNISLTILQIILPYIHLFEEKDVNYIMSKKWRYSWFNNIEKHPIRLKRHNHSKLLNKIRSWPIAIKLKSYLE